MLTVSTLDKQPDEWKKRYVRELQELYTIRYLINKITFSCIQTNLDKDTRFDGENWQFPYFVHIFNDY